MKLLVDVNLSPVWVAYLVAHGVDALHWSAVGDPRASDIEVMDYARREARVVFTHDLDFSALLASSGARGPSVLQIRAHDVLPTALGADLLRVLREHGEALERGAIVTVDGLASRVRVLPLRQRPARG